MCSPKSFGLSDSFGIESGIESGIRYPESGIESGIELNPVLNPALNLELNPEGFVTGAGKIGTPGEKTEKRRRKNRLFKAIVFSVPRRRQHPGI